MDQDARIRALLVELGVSYKQTRLSALLGINQTTLSKAADGTRGVGAKIIKGLVAFGLSPDFGHGTSAVSAWREHMTKPVPAIDPPPESRVALDSEVDPALIAKVIEDARLNAQQAALLRGARWSRGTSEATLRSYAIDLLREFRVGESAIADEPRAAQIMDVVGENERKRR